MSKEKIKSQTILFLSIVLFVIIFKTIFGDENTLIGVTTVTAMLMFLAKDLTVNPIKNTFKLIAFNTALGIIAYIATLNMFIAIPLNFITLFIIGYTLSYNLNTPSYIPFTLQYLFMLAIPVTFERLPLRIASLVVGAISIMVWQLIKNRNRVYRFGNKVLSGVCVSMLNKIMLINNGESLENIDREINRSINQFRKFIYDQREQQFYLTEESRIKLNISVTLDRINNILTEISEIKDEKKLKEIQDISEDIIISIDNVKICFDNEENLKNLDLLFEEMFNKYSKNRTNNLIVLKMLKSIYLLKENLYELKMLGKKKYNVINKFEEIPNNFKIRNLYKKNFRANSLKFSYAFRLALGITIGGFIMDLFHLEEGRWILYTINSLIQPCYEISKQKSKDRIFATIIGTIVVTILFYFIKSTTLRTLIIMLSGYIGGYISEYKYNMIGVTISAIGSAAIMGNTIVLSINRILLVILGVLITMLLSKFVFPYDANDAKRDLVKMYRETILQMLKNTKMLLQNKSANNTAMKNEVLKASMIEEKLISNNYGNEDEEFNKYIETQRLLVLNIYELYRWISSNKENVEDYISIKKDIDELIKNQENMEYGEVENLVNQLDSIHELSSKVVISDYIEILMGINSVNNMSISKI
ncbi:MAG: hypothetical protein E7208_10975 [Clostridium butyricum]|nr:hypothetical protein [Clostridium butyricum]